MTVVGDLIVEFKERPRAGEVLPVLTLTERNGFVRQADRFKKRLATEDTSSYKIIRRLDLAFNPYLLWAGAVAQNTIVDSGVISPLYPTFRVREGHDHGYVARLLLTPQMIHSYDGIAFGSVPRRRRSSVSDFLNLSIGQVPGINEQRRIAAILDHIDVLRAQRHQLLQRLDNLCHSLTSVVTRGATHRVPLGDLIVDGPRNGLYRPASDYGSGVPIVRIDSFKFGQPVLASPLDKRVRASPREIEDFALRPGDLVLNRVNSPEHVGKTALVTSVDEPTVFESNMMRVRVDTERVSPWWLAFFLQTRDIRSQVRPMTKHAVNQASINQHDVRSLTIPLPDRTAGSRFEDAVVQTEARRREISEAMALDDELFASLQARAFNGRL